MKKKKIVIIHSMLLILSIATMIIASAYNTPLPTNTYSYPYYVIYKAASTVDYIVYSQQPMTLNGANYDVHGNAQRYHSISGAAWTGVTDLTDGQNMGKAISPIYDANYDLDGFDYVEPSPSPSPSTSPSPSPSPSPSYEPSPMPEGGFKEVLTPIVGDYVPSVTQTTETISDGTTTTVTTKDVIIPDYAWIGSTIIITIAIYSVFRILGVVIGGVKK